MNILSYGGGTNSTALLIECVKRGIKIDLITFADTGAEKPHTYKYIEIFNKWLIKNGMPEITIVQTVNEHGEKITLEQTCIENKMLPSLAYGFKSCSEKHKIRPQNKFINNWQPAKDEWAAGRKITKLIGYDADESHRTQKDYTDNKYDFWYPLVEWDMGRAECVKTILDAGLCLPGKSACFFCPSSRPNEIKQLKENYPDLMDRALMMEENANLTSVKGLGRNFAWKNIIATDDMFSEGFRMAPELICDCYDG